jgi:iron complex outermembrane receptor protein
LFMGSGGVGYLGAAEMDKGSDGASFQEIDEIVVTASRRSERLQNVAMAVTTIDPANFTSVGLTALDDVIAYTPGVVTIDASEFPTGASSITVRGVSPLSSSGNVATVTTGIYLDNVALTGNSPYSGGSQLGFDGLLGDIERVEFLKGPQGTLYGSTSIGGAVKYVTRKPSLDESKGLLSIDVSSKKEGGLNKIYNGRIGMPLVEDKLGLTVAGFFEDDAGLVDLVDSSGDLLKEDFDSFERYGYSGDILYRFSDRLDFRARVLHQKSDFKGKSATSLQPIEGEAKALFRRFSSNRSGLNDNNIVETNLYSGTFEYHFDSVTLTSTSSFTEADWTTSQDISVIGFLVDGWVGRPAGTTTEWIVEQVVGTEKFTQEIQLASKNSEIWEWLAGIYYTDEETARDNNQIANPGNFVPLTNSSPSIYEETAVFANLTYYITPNFDVTLGSRLSRNELTYSPSVFRDLPLSSFNIKDTFSVDDTVDTWSLAARYRPQDNLSLYARVASGYRPAAVDININASPSIVSEVSSDSLWSYELGAKGQREDGLLSYDVAIWYIDWDNFQANRSVSVGTLLDNAESGVTGKGLEASLVLNPLEGLSVTTSIAYTDSELNEDEPSFNALKGQAIPLIPEWTASSRVHYDFLLEGGYNAHVALGLKYEDSSPSAFVDDSVMSTGSIDSDSYLSIDISSGITIQQVTFNIYATNILNEKAYRSTVFTSTARGTELEPRTVGASLSLSF